MGRRVWVAKRIKNWGRCTLPLNFFLNTVIYTKTVWSISKLLLLDGHLKNNWFFYSSIYHYYLILYFFFVKKTSFDQAVINFDLTLSFMTNNNKDSVARRIICRTHRHQVSRLQLLQTLNDKTYQRFLIFCENFIPLFGRFASNSKNLKFARPDFFYLCSIKLSILREIEAIF